MITKSRLAAVTTVSFAVLLTSGDALADAPLAALPTVPAPPPTPTVSVTPTGDGATAEVGVGETKLSLAASPSGITVGTNATSKPGGGVKDPGAPVSTPDVRRGRNASPVPTGGPGGLLFGPGSNRSASAGGTGRGSAGTRSDRTAGGAAGGPGPLPIRSQVAPGGREHSRLPPFLEFIDRIPPAVKAGIAALALMALALWGAWVRQRRRFEQNAFVDPVTGIANAPAFEGLLARELERARRYKRPLAIVLLEVSEAIHGPLSVLRDQRLLEVTGAILERLREGDIVARLGPARFGVICPEATVASAETLRRALELRLEEMRLHVGVGIAERQPTDLTAADLVARAEPGPAEPSPEPAHARKRALLKAA